MILLFLVGTGSTACEESDCYKGDYYLSTSADLLEFQQEECIEGNLYVRNSALDELDLPALRRVRGSMIINENQHLEVIGDFSALTELTGWLLVDMNPKLVSISGFDQLEVAGEAIVVSKNPLLEDLSGLSSVRTVKGFFMLEMNQSLTDLTSLQSVETIGNGLIVTRCPIENFAGLENLRSVDGDFLVLYNSELRDFTGLSSLETLSGGMRIADNDQLTSLEGLENLSSMGLRTYWDDFGNESEYSIVAHRCPQLSYCELCDLLEQTGASSEVDVGENLVDSCFDAQSKVLTCE